MVPEFTTRSFLQLKRNRNFSLTCLLRHLVIPVFGNWTFLIDIPVAKCHYQIIDLPFIPITTIPPYLHQPVKKKTSNSSAIGLEFQKILEKRIEIPLDPQPTRILSFSHMYRAARNSSPAAFLAAAAAPEAAARFRRNCRLSRAISFYSDFTLQREKSSENRTRVSRPAAMWRDILWSCFSSLRIKSRR